MNVTMTVKLEWNRASGEKLGDFARKYAQMQDHFARMQLQGLLPRGDIKWVIEKRFKIPIELPASPLEIRVLTGEPDKSPMLRVPRAHNRMPWSNAMINMTDGGVMFD